MGIKLNPSQYTKGEWNTTYRKHNDGMYSQEVFDSKGETIATLAWHSVEEAPGHFTTDREANAHLTAAAPNMYEALTLLIKQAQKQGVWCLDAANKPIREVDGLDLSNNIAVMRGLEALAKAEGN